MPKPNQLTTLRVEDFDSAQRSWLPRLFQPLNQFLLSTYNILNGRVDFGANIPCQDQTLRFTYAGNSQAFTYSLNGSPAVLWIGQSTVNAVAVGLQPSWTYDASTRRISLDLFLLNGTALTVGSTYSVFVRVCP